MWISLNYLAEGEILIFPKTNINYFYPENVTLNTQINCAQKAKKTTPTFPTMEEGFF